MNIILLAVLAYAACLYFAGYGRNRDYLPRAHGLIWVGVGLLIPVAVVLMLGVGSVLAIINWVSA